MNTKPANSTIFIRRASSWKHSPTAHFLFCLLQGTGGTILLLLFLTQFFSGEYITTALPLIIGFNAAVSGFGFCDKQQSVMAHHTTWLLLIACFFGVLGWFIALMFSPLETLPSPVTYLYLGTSAICSTFLGAWLSIKNSATSGANHNTEEEEKQQ